MSNFVAVYDACVLYPAPLRDLLCFSESWSAVALAVGRLQGRVLDAFEQPVSNRKWTTSFTSHRSYLRSLKRAPPQFAILDHKVRQGCVHESA